MFRQALHDDTKYWGSGRNSLNSEGKSYLKEIINSHKLEKSDFKQILTL
jgi:hypothetical protein